ncbi:SET domain-containing protein [Chryseosolibacter indicus]|uniref:SET domain-containing protein-lysine N-methyltransferase n=1 Tax=Chryseosolibacter indicus TaxID=2782351 RepID=A0ABS5VYB3_9BACT|nr:SET domain-containing protein [Chryseosolibacter indicus]MBT1705914.1 SET domain-containing protein-lysine N-methyltransferase [Chryseosolibacter indicus]
MLHPHTEVRFINDKIGYGVVATKLIPKGTITWALDKLDRIFTPADIEKMQPVYRQIIDKYTYRNPQGNYVLCWDSARFVNHSANSNCITTAYEFEIAIRDIQPGEELTDDYGYLNVEEPFEVLPEPGSNRTVVYPDDLVRYYNIWDEKLLSAFPKLLAVEQPLFEILEKPVQEKAKQIALGQLKMDSILNCYYRNGNHNGKNGKEKPELIVRSPQVNYPF